MNGDPLAAGKIRTHLGDHIHLMLDLEAEAGPSFSLAPVETSIKSHGRVCISVLGPIHRKLKTDRALPKIRSERGGLPWNSESALGRTSAF